MQSAELEKILLEAGEPPTMPHVALKVLGILSDPDFSPVELSRTLRSDTGLATRILKIANSAFYGCPREIGSLDRAVLMLGSRTVKNLVLAASTREVHQDSGLIEHLLWDHSVAMAIGCHMIAGKLKIDLREDALVCGLLQNIGQVVMKKLFTDLYEQAIQQSYNTGQSFESVEHAIFGFGHAEVGSYMIRTWRLAESIEMVLAHQHDLEALQNAAPAYTKLGAVVQVTKALARYLGLGERQPDPDALSAAAAGAAHLGLGPDELEDLSRELKENHAAERQYFE